MSCIGLLAMMAKHIRGADREQMAADYRNADSADECAQVRRQLKNLEGGRWYDVLESTHKMFCFGMNELDREEFTRENYELVQWMGVYALVEDLNTFPDYTNVYKIPEE